MSATIFKVALKITILLLAIVACATFNSWYINGPLLEHNTALSMQQFKGTSTTAGGDIEIGGGYSISFSTLYIIEVIAVALLAVFLFLGSTLKKAQEADDDEAI